MPETELWKKAFLEYTRNQEVVSKWVNLALSQTIRRTVETAVDLVEVEQYPPDAVTLGFSPQVLIAALAARLKKGLPPSITVVTSPEVERGEPRVAYNSHLILEAALKEGLVENLVITNMSPKPSLPPDKVIGEATSKLAKLKENNVGIVDISGGTQLIPLALIKAGITSMTYTYPNGEKTIIYYFKVNP